VSGDREREGERERERERDEGTYWARSSGSKTAPPVSGKRSASVPSMPAAGEALRVAIRRRARGAGANADTVARAHRHEATRMVYV